jgi:hypothetical protein
MTLAEKKAQFKKMNPFQSFVKFALENKKLLIDALQEQMQQGKNGNGNTIGKYANALYKKEKQQLNPKASGNVDLKLTGAFYKGMFMEIESSDKNVTLKFYSHDEKADKLTAKYKPIIWVFNKETIIQVNDIINEKIKFL